MCFIHAIFKFIILIGVYCLYFAFGKSVVVQSYTMTSNDKTRDDVGSPPINIRQLGAFMAAFHCFGFAERVVIWFIGVNEELMLNAVKWLFCIQKICGIVLCVLSARTLHYGIAYLYAFFFVGVVLLFYVTRQLRQYSLVVHPPSEKSPGFAPGFHNSDIAVA